MARIYILSIFLILLFSRFAFSQQNNISFSVSSTQGCAPLSVQFTNTSTIDTNGVTFAWRMGNGPVVFGYNASYAFWGGSHYIHLSAYNQSGQIGSWGQYIYIDGSSNDFNTSTGTVACPGQTIAFHVSDQVNSFTWQLSDGTTSQQHGFEHAFATPGVYTVTLNENTSCGPYAIVKQITVADTVKPFVHIGTSVNSNACPGDKIGFNNQYDASEYLWSFGDGTYSTLSNPEHAFPAVGNYNVVLKATNPCGNFSRDTFVVNIDNNLNAEAGFNFWSSNPCPGEFVRVYTWSSGTYKFYMGDGTIYTSKSFEHAYADTGIYTIKLVVENACGSKDSSEQAVHVQYHPQNWTPEAGFYFNNFDNWSNNGPVDTLRVCSNTYVEFRAWGGSATQYNWNFNGTTVIGNQLEGYTFTTPGINIVRLIVRGMCGGADTAYKYIFIDNSIMPESRIAVLPSNVCPGDKVYFYDENYNGQLNYSIWFGDQTSQLNFSSISDTSLYTLASHIYSSEGSYNYIFTASNACGNADTISGTIVVSNSPTSNPEYYVGNSTNEGGKGDWPDMGQPSGDDDHQFFVPVHFDMWTPDLSNKFYFVFWSGRVTLGNNMPEPIGLLLKEGQGTAHAYIPSSIDSVTIAAAWWCNGVPESDPDAFSFLGTLNVEPDGITTIPEPGLQITGWDGTCDPVAIDSNRAVCPGEFIKFSAAGGQSYRWHFGDNSPVDTNQVAFHAYAAEGVHNAYVEITNGCGQKDTLYTQAYVANIGIKWVDIRLENGSACIGEDVHFDVSDYNWGMGNHDGKSYLWNFGDGTTSTLKRPVHRYAEQGNYNVTLVVSNNCGSKSAERNIFINGPAINKSVSQGCNNMNNAYILFEANGYSPITYNWSVSNSGNTLSNAQPGTYFVTITDNGGCSVVDTTVILNPDEISITVNKSDISCFGQTDGMASAFVTGGVGPYNYIWSNGSENISVSSLEQGMYYITIIDREGCSNITGFSIVEPEVLAVSLSPANAVCNQSATGNVSSNVSGGVAPYLYQWSNSILTQNITGVTAGIYGLTVSDANGCFANANTTVNEPAAIVSNVNITPPTCNQSNGSAQLVPSGGVPPYSYLWSDASTQTTVIASNLASGNYYATITDSQNCSTVVSAAVTDAGAPSLTVNHTNVDCNGNNTGNIVASASGGTGSLAYSWSISQDSTGSSISNLHAGAYVLTVTDASGCKAVGFVQIQEPDMLQAYLHELNPSCFGLSNGKIHGFASGGTSPFTFAWDNSTNADSIINLPAGTYVVTITDANQCSVIVSKTLTQPDQLAVNINMYHVKCFGENNGAAKAEVEGGTLPYSFNWSVPSGNDSIFDLSSGNYSVTVSDLNNCIKVESFTINNGNVVDAVISSQNIKCHNACDGQINITPSGGVAPYSFIWNDNQTGGNLSSLCAGNYQVTIHDANNCQKDFTVLLTQPTPLFVAITRTNTSCSGVCDGQLVASISGGTTPYSPVWDDNSTGDSRFNLCVGNYTLTVNDANNCEFVASKAIFAPQPIVPVFYFSNVLCNGEQNGIASVNPYGGFGPYTFIWENSSVNDTISNLAPGYYDVEVTDSRGCSKIDSVLISEPTELLVVASITDASSQTASDGAIQLNVSGGTIPYSYNWPTLPGETSASVSGLLVGAYAVTVSDANGCNTSDTIVVSFTNTVSKNSIADIIKIYPNPTTGVFNVSNANGSVVEIFNVIGKLEKSVYISNSMTQIDLSALAKGNYYVRVTMNGKSETRKLVLE